MPSHENIIGGGGRAFLFGRSAAIATPGRAISSAAHDIALFGMETPFKSVASQMKSRSVIEGARLTGFVPLCFF
jgi:hypothetical protein